MLSRDRESFKGSSSTIDQEFTSTPSPSDSAVGDLENVLKEKDSEIRQQEMDEYLYKEHMLHMRVSTENIIPEEAALTADAMLWLMLFSTMLVRRSRPRRMPQPRMSASSEPSMEKPRIGAA